MLYKVLVMFRYGKKAPCEKRPSLEITQSVADRVTPDVWCSVVWGSLSLALVQHYTSDEQICNRRQ